MAEHPETVASTAPGVTNAPHPVSPDAGNGRDDLSAAGLAVLEALNPIAPDDVKPDRSTGFAAYIAEQVEQVLLGAGWTPPTGPLAEWCCPACGQTTRARLADKIPTATELALAHGALAHTELRRVVDALGPRFNTELVTWPAGQLAEFAAATLDVEDAPEALTQAIASFHWMRQRVVELQAERDQLQRRVRSEHRKYADAVREINRLNDAHEQCDLDEDESEGRPIVDVHLPEVPGG